MNFLLHRPCPAKTEAVEALFAENLSAHQRAGQAADAVALTSSLKRRHIEAIRAEIAQHTAKDRFARPNPSTSDVRQLVEDVLSRPGLRGLPLDRDKS